MTIRASSCLAVITGALGLFATSPAQADARLGAALNSAATKSSIVVKAGFWDEDECRRPRYRYKSCDYSDDSCSRRRYREYRAYRGCESRRWRRHRHHHGSVAYRKPQIHYHFHYPMGPNYQIYTYRKPYEVGPRTDVQAVYGWYEGYYAPYPWYPGVGYPGY
jgi:hypothetical protein